MISMETCLSPSVHQALGILGLKHDRSSPILLRVAALSMGSESCPTKNLHKFYKRRHLKEALDCLDRQGISLDRATFASLLQECGRVKRLTEGEKIHDHIRRHGFDSDLVLCNHLIDMYGKCGSVANARKVFDEMTGHNIFSWTGMIGAYVQQDQSKEALQLFNEMQLQNTSPNKVTFIILLKTFHNPRDLGKGKMFHACIITRGYEADVTVGNAVIWMYKMCWSLRNALETFNKMDQRSVVSWTVMISTFLQFGHGDEALQLLPYMRQESIKPDKVIFISVLDACASMASLLDGKIIHSQIVVGGLANDLLVGTSLIKMYAECSSLQDAFEIFRRMSFHDIVSWTAMLSAFCHHKMSGEAVQMFRYMMEEGLMPNKFTFVAMLDACASMLNIAVGKFIHIWIITSGSGLDTVVGNALVNFYGKCGDLSAALAIVIRIDEWDVVTWTALASSYVQCGYEGQALRAFQNMQEEGVEPDKIVLTVILDTCALMGALSEGKQVYDYILKSGLETDVVLATAIINMYGKCGILETAERIFNRMHKRNASLWNSIIAICAQHGEGIKAFHFLQGMHLHSLVPDELTTISVLTGCSHARLVNKGFHLFLFMRPGYNITLTTEHYGSMIALLGQLGWGDEMEDLVLAMPVRHDSITWMIFLNVCGIYR